VSERPVHGMVTMSGAGLRELGDSMSQVVYFKPQQPAGFVQIPIVLATVRGSLPYAISVSDIDTTQFKLTLTAIFTPAADNIEPIYVEWMAYV
jgi:hypothetical protein